MPRKKENEYNERGCQRKGTYADNNESIYYFLSLIIFFFLFLFVYKMGKPILQEKNLNQNFRDIEGMSMTNPGI